MQQMIECLLARQEEMNANTKAMREDIKSGQAEMRSIVGAIEEKMDVWVAHRRDDQKGRMSCQEMMEALLECEELTSADMKACQEAATCHEATEADTEKIEPDPGMMQSIEEHQEIPKAETAVMLVGGLRKRVGSGILLRSATRS
jgi:hypothetical protein